MWQSHYLKLHVPEIVVMYLHKTTQMVGSYCWNTTINHFFWGGFVCLASLCAFCRCENPQSQRDLWNSLCLTVLSKLKSLYIDWWVSKIASLGLQPLSVFADILRFCHKNAFIYISHLFVFKFSLALVKEGHFLDSWLCVQDVLTHTNIL